MTESDRIMLAEAMGWTKVKPYRRGIYGLIPGDSASNDALWLEFCRQIPDPENNAEDAEELIKFLNYKHFEPRINFWYSHVEIRIDHHVHPEGPKIHRWDGQNWKRGLCELAIAVVKEQK